jgi:hypothetical protein
MRNKDTINLEEAYSQILLEAKKKLTDKQKKIAAAAPPYDKITKADIITLAKKKGKKKLNENNQQGPFSLYYKDPEIGKTRKFYTANTLEDLVKKVNKGNTGMYYSLPVVDEEHVFQSVEELLDYCSNSDFIITDGTGELVSGYRLKD